MTKEEALEEIMKIRNQAADIKPYWSEIIEIVEILLKYKEEKK